MTATYNARPGSQPGTVARARYIRMSATKARAVLDLIRGQDVRTAEETLRFCERDAALVVGKLLHSAVANAEHNDDQIGDDLMVSACYADEGRTIRRFRPRARGRATRIRKRTCHITIVVSRMSEEQLERRRQRQANRPGARTARRAGQEAAEERAPRTRRRRSRKSEAAPTPSQSEVQEATAQPEPAETPTASQEEAVPQEAEAAPPEAEEPELTGGLSMFEDEGEADPAGGQTGAPAKDTPPQADNEEDTPPQADSEKADTPPKADGGEATEESK